MDEELLKALNKSDILGFYIYSTGGYIVYANNAFCNFVGYTPEELKQTKLIDLIDESYKKEADGIIKRRLQGEDFVVELQEILYKTKQGFIRPAMNFCYTATYNNNYAGIVIVVDQAKQKIYEIFYRILSNINRIISETENEKEALEKICKVISEEKGIDLAVIGAPDPKKLSYKPLFAYGGKAYKTLFKKSKISIDPQKPSGRGTIGQAYWTKKIVSVGDVYKNDNLSYWRDLQKRFGVYSICSIPLLRYGKTEYILTLYSKIKNLFSEEYLFLFENIKKVVSAALEKFEINKLNRILLTAIDKSFDLTVVADKNLKIQFVGGRIEQILGYKKEEILGKPFKILIYETADESLFGFYRKLRKSNLFSEVALCKAKNGTPRKVMLQISQIKSDTTYYIAAIKDITNEKVLIKAIDDILKKDPLTGLLNRDAFIDAINRFIERAKYKKILGGVCIINPVQFSSINEMFGFEAGNEILKSIAKRITAFLRSYDVVAKLETSRFGVLFKDMSNTEDIISVSSNLLNLLSKPYKTKDGRAIQMIFNFGVSVFPVDGKTADELLLKAHFSLKEANRNSPSISFYKEEIKEKITKSLKIKMEAEKALSKKEFALFYQPYFETLSQKIAGSEALVRWIKEGNIISPIEFIPVLERSNLIDRFEKYIVDHAINALKKIPKPLKLSINITPTNLKNKAFVDFLTKKAGDFSKNISIEITERLLLENLSKAREILTQLKDNGFSISVDDFGTGYSSLSYISNLPIDTIKIDICFTRKMVEDAKTRAIVNTIIYLARQLNLKTIAEGVETKEQLEILKEFGCDYIQGYLLAKPMPESEFLQLINSNF
ncbi:EAL domain-containing protein [Hippea jasoniae]|uniref:EAL domain-containing protein n=1 Tax=Hippea jasoniae TaxID=944479 RepID=UPI0005554A88|nr:EAL domain-containing protein [Hippea jasoniae]